MSVNISQAMNSPSYAHKLWLNYYYGDNSMNISASVIGRIESKYGEDSGYNYIAQWEKNAAIDQNDYEFTDEELSSFKTQGEESAKSQTGYENNTGDKVKQWGRVGADAANGVAQGAGIAMTTGGKGATILGHNVGFGNSAGVAKAGEKGAKAGQKAGEALAQKAGATGDDAANIAKNSAEAGKSSAEGAKQTTNDIFLAVACALNLATGIAAVAKTANEEQYNAVVKANEIMGEQMSMTMNAQSEMETMSQELMDATDEAATVNDDANTKIDEEKTKYDLYKATYERLSAKNEAARNGGEPLTKEEQDLLANVTKYMSESGVLIEQAQDEASTKVNDIHSDMESYQEGFDSAAETIGTTQGITEYAAGFDEATKTACTVEAVAQGVNAVSGGVNAVKAGVKVAQSAGVWPLMIAWGAAAAAAVSGAIMSGIAAMRQFAMIKGSKDNPVGIDQELQTRANTEALTTQTQEIYSTEVDNFAQNVTSVEELELIVPDDTSVPDEVTIVEGQQQPAEGEETEENNEQPRIEH